MADSKDFVAGVDSNAKKSPRRIVFITRRTSAQVTAETEEQIQTFPEVLFRAAVAIQVLATVLVWIALFFNAPLEGLADPSHTPNPAKAPWYFLGLQEMLVYFDPWIAGVVMPTLIIIGLMAIPYIDANPLGNGYYTYRQRRFAIWTFCAGFIGLWVAMISIGTFIRGPGWMWFWPGQTWDAERVDYAVNRNLDQVFGIDGSWLAAMTHMSKDQAAIWARVIFGVFPTVLFFIAAGFLVHWICMRTEFARKMYKRMSLVQLVTMYIFLILMISLPIKILLRLVFTIKYVWVTPWFSI